MKIYIAKNPAEAHIVCELLKTEQIACEVRGEGMFGLKGELPLAMILTRMFGFYIRSNS